MSYSMSESYCRVCLKNKGFRPIFGDGHNPDISKEVCEFGSILIAKDDNLPKHICSQCFEQLQGAVTFRKQAKRTDTFLQIKTKSLCLAVQNNNENKVTSQPIEIHYEKKAKDRNYQVASHLMVRRSSMPSVTGTDFEDHHSSDQAVVKTEQILEDNKVGLHFMFGNSINNVGNDTNENSVTTWVSSNGPIPEVGNFYCTYCNLTFNIASDLEEHKNTIAHKTNYVTSFFPVDNDDNRTPNEIHENNEIHDSDRECDICGINVTKSVYLSHMLGEHKDAINQKTDYVMSYFLSDNDNDTSSINNTSNNKKTEQSMIINESEKTCEICEKIFTQQEYLNHMLLEHNMLIQLSPNIHKVPCLVCKKLITAGPSYRRHLKRMHKHRKNLPKLTLRVECPICKILFNSTSYSQHCLVAHNQGKSYICDQCGKVFYHLFKLNSHVLKHSKDFPYKCDHCPYRAYNRSLLATHVRTHTGDYRYKCPHCDCRYITKSNLSAHIKRKHRGPIDFICDLCSRGFYTKLELERHITIRHKGIKTHVCSICGAAYGYPRELRRHEIRTHKRPKMLNKLKPVYLR